MPAVLLGRCACKYAALALPLGSVSRWVPRSVARACRSRACAARISGLRVNAASSSELSSGSPSASHHSAAAGAEAVVVSCGARWNSVAAEALGATSGAPRYVGPTVQPATKATAIKARWRLETRRRDITADSTTAWSGELRYGLPEHQRKRDAQQQRNPETVESLVVGDDGSLLLNLRSQLTCGLQFRERDISVL